MMKAPEIMRAKASATVTAHQIPSSPMIRGRSSTARVWNTKVRRNEIAADTPQLFSAVTKEEANTFMPYSTKENA